MIGVYLLAVMHYDNVVLFMQKWKKTGFMVRVSRAMVRHTKFDHVTGSDIRLARWLPIG